ncbi:mRNA cap guanine-N7 methyltransferase 2 isoform X3 [Olea europaea var. sylvestris]|uniref:mRNA cap guanine-N7 methyltransferase 2 isoform X1 n=1 Tax=Olea europaea var. sylvestris TaxID=158386 RepID=UPI000C1D5ACA|nr:mRNA cap guanine-N7 methyltransferase 2 isoform X1 [Olea europaea var. sylvestris]XP_022860481.1 mRNA cap guanine-N7 methyltransferase 2 isoform X3 [Olea europaea var. sylvestris]
MMPNSFQAHRPTESIYRQLVEFAKTVLVRVFVPPYATVCDLYCGKVPDEEKWDEAQIGHYIGIDVATTGLNEVKEAWESQRKAYTSEFFELDPCIEDMEPHLKDGEDRADIAFCMHHLPLCFESEEKVRRLLFNVSLLLKPGGYFIGITPDSSTIWNKYQKNVEAYHNKSSGMKPNIVPNCIRSESYMITFEVEEEKFPFFGKKYQLKFAGDISAETHCLVHFPSLLRLAREAGLEYMEITNLTEFFDDNRAQFASMLMDAGPNLVDPRGRLLPRSYDVLGLYTTFIFQKPDPDIAPPLSTPVLEDGSYNHDERGWQGTDWREDEKNGKTDSAFGLGKITEQKGILGPGPAELRFPEAL